MNSHNSGIEAGRERDTECNQEHIIEEAVRTTGPMVRAARVRTSWLQASEHISLLAMRPGKWVIRIFPQFLSRLTCFIQSLRMLPIDHSNCKAIRHGGSCSGKRSRGLIAPWRLAPDEKPSLYQLQSERRIQHLQSLIDLTHAFLHPLTRLRRSAHSLQSNQKRLFLMDGLPAPGGIRLAVLRVSSN